MGVDDSTGVLTLENTFRTKGGPARHLHHDQDEWFYAAEAEFVVDIGPERLQLRSGDSILPRESPHVWAHVGDTTGRMLIEFVPANKMEAIFREVIKGDAMLPLDADLGRAHGMELLGPPLNVE